MFECDRFAKWWMCSLKKNVYNLWGILIIWTNWRMVDLVVRQEAAIKLPTDSCIILMFSFQFENLTWLIFISFMLISILDEGLNLMHLILMENNGLYRKEIIKHFCLFFLSFTYTYNYISNPKTQVRTQQLGTYLLLHVGLITMNFWWRYSIYDRV